MPVRHSNFLQLYTWKMAYVFLTSTGLNTGSADLAVLLLFLETAKREPLN